MKLRVSAPFLIAISLAPPVGAQSKAVNIYVEATGQDSVGTRLRTKVKESIAASPLFNLVYNEDVALIKLSLVTLEPSMSHGDMTVYSEVITIPRKGSLDAFLTSGVGTCGINKVDSCAESIKADIDGQVTLLRQVVQSMDK